MADEPSTHIEQQDERLQGEAEAPRFIQYAFFKADPAWRRLS